jgi:hypothetical protein
VLGRGFYTFLSQKWNFDQIVNNFIALKTIHFGYSCSFQLLDKGVLEFCGPKGLGWFFPILSKNFSKAHSGLSYKYLFFMVFSLVSLTTLYLLFVYNFLACLNILVLLSCYYSVVLNLADLD